MHQKNIKYSKKEKKRQIFLVLVLCLSVFFFNNLLLFSTNICIYYSFHKMTPLSEKTTSNVLRKEI